MKKMFCILSLLLIAVSVLAQKKEPVNLDRDKIQFLSYTIRILPLQENTYGYEISKGRDLVLVQMNNPFTQTPLGLETKEDAYKLAKWQVMQLQQQFNQQEKGKNNNKVERGIQMNKPIPMQVAIDLNIKTQHSN